MSLFCFLLFAFLDYRTFLCFKLVFVSIFIGILFSTILFNNGICSYRYNELCICLSLDLDDRFSILDSCLFIYDLAVC